MLRHYDKLGLVRPTGRTSGGYREYVDDDIRRLFHVESLRTLGLSLDETRRALDDPDCAPVELVGNLARHTRARIASEQELLTRLEHVDATAPTRWDDVLRIVHLLRALESGSGSLRQQALLSQDPSTSLPVDALVEAVLSEDDPNVAGALHWSLARAGGRGLPALAAAMESDAAEVRRRAVEATTAVRTADATALLRRALADDDPTVRTRAALALGDRGDTAAVPTLVELVVAGRRDVEAAELLGSLSETAPSTCDIVGALQDALAAAHDAPTRLRLTQALAEIPGAAAREVLTRLTADDDRTVAGTATAILGRTNPGRRSRSRVREDADPW